MRPYITAYLIATTVAAILAALCMVWTLYEGAAQADDKIGDDVLTVEQCLDNSTDGPLKTFEETLISDGILEKGLLQTKMTGSTCEEMLERAPADGTPMGKLVTAQNYILEIELIEEAMREAAGEAAATRTDRHLPAAGSLLLVRAVAQSSSVAAQVQYGGDEPGGDEPPRGGGGAAGGGGNGSGFAPTMKQATAISGAAQTDSDASIAERLNQKEDAGMKAGASQPEAAAGSRCSLELELLGSASKKLYRGKFRISPVMPKEMQHGDTKTVKLFVSGTTKDVYEELVRQYEEVAEASSAKDQCVGLTSHMKAVLTGRGFDISPLQGHDSLVRPITQSTAWGWDITASTEGRHPLHLSLGQELRQAGEESDFNWVEPSPLDKTITVRATLLQKVSDTAGRNWQWLLPPGVLLTAAVWLARILWKRHQQRSSSEQEEQGWV